MATSFFALLDDIASVLDDVSVMTKVAAKKTSGVLGDDLALNAQMVHGVNPNREIPVVLAVAKGSARNKLILVPLALLLSSFLPILVTPFLMLGGLYLCFEGCEKILHSWLHPKEALEAHKKEHLSHLQVSDEDLLKLEQEKIRGAVRTDFILSAEIIVITLGTLQGASFLNQVAVLVSISVLMTVGVYGLVAMIIKLDDLGLWLKGKKSIASNVGDGILWLAPMLMKLLSIVGTVAMFLVGGGIVHHGIPSLHHWVTDLFEAMPFSGAILAAADGLVGFVAGLLCLGLVLLYKKLAAKK